MPQTPLWLELLFGLTTLLTLVLFLRATPNKKSTGILFVLWLAIVALAALFGFTQITTTPPRLLLLLVFTLISMLILFSTRGGRKIIDSLDTAELTLVHCIRIPVELVLFLLYTYGTVSEIITFEGRNMDILAGISAPFVYYFGYRKKLLSRRVLIGWNFLALALLFNVVIHAILSAPFPFQQLSFDQPNIAVLYFPYVWLPTFIVPIVLFSHLVTLRSLFKRTIA